MDLDYFANVQNNVSLIINRHLPMTLFAWRSCAATVGVQLVPLPYNISLLARVPFFLFAHVPICMHD